MLYLKILMRSMEVCLKNGVIGFYEACESAFESKEWLTLKRPVAGEKYVQIKAIHHEYPMKHIDVSGCADRPVHQCPSIGTYMGDASEASKLLLEVPV